MASMGLGAGWRWMARGWIELWGCGRGPVTKLPPQVRIAGGMLVLCACLLAPTSGSAGVSFLGVTTGGWLFLCRPSRSVLRALAVLPLAVLLPVALVAGAAMGGAAGRWVGAGAAVETAWELFLRGFAVALVVGATAATVPLAELRVGLLALPVPRMAAAILFQIVHQTGALLEETGRVALAVTVRGAGRGGGRLWVALCRAWLPRLLARAERVAAAMEVRGLGESHLANLGVRRTRPGDRAALLLLAGVVALAAVLRWEWLP